MLYASATLEAGRTIAAERRETLPGGAEAAALAHRGIFTTR